MYSDQITCDVIAFSMVDVYNFQGRRVEMEAVVSSITPVSKSTKHIRKDNDFNFH
jgi:hypothetical protein